jgi:hypothetical protein
MDVGNHVVVGETMELIVQYWPQILTVAGIGGWLMRLEGRVTANAKGIDDLEKLRSEDLNAAKEAREATNTRLDKLDTKLDSIFAEIRGDLKLLFTKGDHG